jgi:group I intron endonuclease
LQREGVLNLNLQHFVQEGTIAKNINNINYNYKDYRNNLFELENMYLTALNPKYNILLEAGTSIGYKHTDETIEKLKKSFTQERRKLLSKLNTGRVLSESTKEKLRVAALNRPIDYLSLESRLLLSKYSSKIVKLFDNNNNYLCEFPSLKVAHHYLCCSYKTIQRALDLG